MYLSPRVLKILRSSIFVSVSGGFKLYVAFLLIGLEFKPFICLSFVFLTYSVYTLDRTFDYGSTKNLKEIGLITSIITIFLGLTFFIVIKKNLPLYIPIIPFLAGLLYSIDIGIKGKNISFKKGYGVKNLVVSLTWAGTLAAYLTPYSTTLQLTAVFIFFFLKSFINTVIYDFRDIKEDFSKGLKTLPVFLSKKRTQMLLYSIHIFLHLAMISFLLLGFIKSILLRVFSGLIGVLYITFYAKPKTPPLRDLLVDGEWITFITFRRMLIHTLHFVP